MLPDHTKITLGLCIKTRLRSAFVVEMTFHFHSNKTPFHKKCCALGLILKERAREKETRERLG